MFRIFKFKNDFYKKSMGKHVTMDIEEKGVVL